MMRTSLLFPHVSCIKHHIPFDRQVQHDEAPSAPTKAQYTLENRSSHLLIFLDSEMTSQRKSQAALLALQKLPRGKKSAETIQAGTPLPLLREPEAPEEFPTECIGPMMANAAAVVSDVVQVPIEICAQSALAAASLLAQELYDVRVDGRQCPSSCFFLTIAGSGERKSAADTIFLKAIREFERQKLIQYQKELLDYQKKLQIHEAAKARLLKQNKQKNLQTLGREFDELEEAPLSPPSPIMLLQEPTYEGLMKHIASDCPSVGLFSDEGGRLLGGHALNQENQLKTAAGFSEAWDGKPITRSRAGDGTSKLYGRRLAVHLMLQPNVSGLFLGNALFVGQGLIARFLSCYPKSIAGSREYRAIDCTQLPEVLALYARQNEIMQRGLRFAAQNSLEIKPQILELSAEAKEQFIEVYKSFESEVGANGAYSSIASFANKGPEHALRLAAVIHCIESDDLKISAETLKNASKLAHWYASECLRLWGTREDSQELILAQATLDWLKKCERQSIVLQDLYQKGPKGIRSAEASKRIVQILVEHGHLRPILSTTEHGLAPSQWEVVHA